MPAAVNSVVGHIRTQVNGICGQGPAVDRVTFPPTQDAFLNPLMCFKRLDVAPVDTGDILVVSAVDDDIGGEVEVNWFPISPLKDEPKNTD